MERRWRGGGSSRLVLRQTHCSGIFTDCGFELQSACIHNFMNLDFWDLGQVVSTQAMMFDFVDTCSLQLYDCRFWALWASCQNQAMMFDFFGTVHARAAYNSMDVDFDTSERSSKRSCDFWFFEAVVRVRLQRADWDFGTSERVLKPDNAVWFFGQRAHASTIPWTYEVQQPEKCGFKMQDADSCSLPKAVKFFRYLQFSSCVATCCFQVASKNWPPIIKTDSRSDFPSGVLDLCFLLPHSGWGHQFQKE